MNFKRIDKKKVNQKISVYDSTPYDIEADFTIENKRIKNINLKIVNEDGTKDVMITSAVLCKHVVTIGTYFLRVNLLNLEEYVSDYQNNNKKKCKDKNKQECIEIIKKEMQHVVQVTFNSNDFIIKEGTCIFSDVKIDSKIISIDESSCKIKIFKIVYNPQHENGNIIIGYP